VPEEPAPAAERSSGSRASARLSPALALASAWAGDALALIVGGSHASGSAVWAPLGGREFCLSDLDVYAVVRDRAAQRAAEARARADRTGLRARLLDWGLAAPLEVAFLVPADLACLPARPSTLELARHGLVVSGDPVWRDRVPRWEPADVSREEILLLHENRAFELLLAWPALRAGVPLARLQARHAVLKCALDVVRVEALDRGEYPDGPRALAEWAGRSGRSTRDEPARATFLALLETAVAWRAGQVGVLGEAGAMDEWRTVVAAWVAAWQARVGPTYGDAVRGARRARLRRRVRRAFSSQGRSGVGPPLAGRLRYALCGTPQHRVNASAAVLLLAAAEAGGSGVEPSLPALAKRSLAGLGVAPATAREEWATAARAVAGAWDRWVLDGQRTVEPA
jgi:hypothetical protein